MNNLRIAVLFGSKSPEHEVSIITAVQAMASMPEGYEVIPLYVTKTGTILTGDHLKSISSYQSMPLLEKLATQVALPSSPTDKNLIPVTNSIFPKSKKPFDVIFPCFHGGVGEGGWIQGLAEYYGIPQVGTGLTGAVLGMDKISMKYLFGFAGIEQAPFVWFYRQEWQQDKQAIFAKVKKFHYPMFVKPSRGGSSIGTTCAKNKLELERAIDLAVALDTRIIIEEGIVGAREINISVMGNAGSELETSVCEEVFHGQDDFLNFEKKYLGGSKAQGMANMAREIPAKLNISVAGSIAKLARQAFNLLDCAGLVRFDFLVKDNKVYVIEVNTIPGCLSFFIWEKSGYTYPQLLTKLVGLALKKHEESTNTITDFASPILSQIASDSKLGSKLHS